MIFVLNFDKEIDNHFHKEKQTNITLNCMYTASALVVLRQCALINNKQDLYTDYSFNNQTPKR